MFRQRNEQLDVSAESSTAQLSLSDNRNNKPENTNESSNGPTCKKFVTQSLCRVVGILPGLVNYNDSRLKICF